MKVLFDRCCLLDPETAALYIHYCKENEINFEASSDGPLVYISFYDTETKLKALNKWILKTLKH
jgi:hypothetical protein